MSEPTLMVSVIGPVGTGPVGSGPVGSGADNAGSGAPIVTRAVGTGGAWIGRSAACEILVDDPQRHVSLRHCRIDSAEGGFWVTDMSTNGTFLNDSLAPLPKGQRQALAAGDRLRVGAFVIAFDPPAADVIQPGPSLVTSFAEAPVSPLLDPAWALPARSAAPSDRSAEAAPHDGSADSLGALLADLLANPAPLPSTPADARADAGPPTASPFGVSRTVSPGDGSPGPALGASTGPSLGPSPGAVPGPVDLPMFAPPPPAPVEPLEAADPFSLLPPPAAGPVQPATVEQTLSWPVAGEPPVPPVPTATAEASRPPIEAPPLGVPPLGASPLGGSPAEPIAMAGDPTTTAVDELVSALASEIVRPPAPLAPRPQDVEVYAPDRAGSAATRALAAFWCGLGIMPKGLDPASLATVMMDLGAALREATDGFAAMTAAANRAAANPAVDPVGSPATDTLLAPAVTPPGTPPGTPIGSGPSATGQANPPPPATGRPPHPPGQQGPFANGHADLRRLIEDRDAASPRLDELIRTVFAAAAEREDFQAAAVRIALHRALRSMTASAVRTRFAALLRGRREATRRAELIDLMFKMEAELIELAETHFRRELADALQTRIGRRISFGGPRR